jgi:hypothetical protein
VAGRKIVDEREARALLARFSRSKAEPSTWARMQGIDGRSLTAWRLIIERKRRKEPAARRARRPAERSLQLVELVPTELVASPALARYAIKIAGAVVEFGDDARTDTLRRVVEALRSC